MNLTKLFRYTGRLEALSYLLLLGVAMPLKYHWGMPMAVRVTGMIHGLLFLAYVGTAFAMYDREDWSIKKLAGAVIASLLPFGPFVFEAREMGRLD